MRFVRYLYGSDVPRYGWLHEDHIGPIDGDLFNEYRRLETDTPLPAVKLLAPVVPSKIICLVRNFAEHAKEQGGEVPEIPSIFLKAPSAVIGPNESIVLPPQSHQVEHEAELAVVIKKKGRWIPSESAMSYILGYTIANDVTARDIQQREGHRTRSKSFDTFCPLGPWIETELDPYDALITCQVNGEMRQMASTREMFFTIPRLIAFISSIMTLFPGDVILTGTPAGVSALQPGDQVSIQIEGIGQLNNSVREENVQRT